MRAEFNRTTNSYDSIVNDGIVLIRNSPPFTQDLTSDEEKEIITEIVNGTKGWFSKPLTTDWLQGKLQLNIPVEQLGQDFEGSVKWKLERIEIRKLVFILHFGLFEKQEAPKINLELDFELPAPLTPSPTPIAKEFQTTRRKQQKEYVSAVREKAARLLFKAERLTQEYCQTYGEDTDWEDEISDAESV